MPSEEDMRLPNTKGDLTLEQLETAKLSAEDIPEYISRQDIEEKGHVNRLRAQEPDDNTIVFQNRDGTKTAYFFSSPVKYTDESGDTKDKYTKLDNKNISDKHSKKYGYVNQQNDIKTYFPKQIASSQGMLLENENVSVELIPIEATEKKYVLENGSIVTPGEYISKNQTVSTKTLNSISTSNGIIKIQSEKLTAQKANANKVHITDELTSITKDTVQYNGVFGSKTTLRYSSTFEGLKEDIVLSENTGVNNFSFRLKTNGLSLVCGEDKQYYLADPLSGEYLVAIGELIVYDSNNRIYKNDEGEEYNHHYEVTTVKTDQEYILTVVVDEEFLNSSDTAYPVYIDPTMTVMPKGSVRDAAIYSGGYAFANDEKIVKVGCSGSYGIGRGLYNFPILNFNTDFILMYGNQISSARLKLYALPYGSSSSYDSSKTLSMYEFYSPWSPSTVKWNNTSPYNYGTYISSANVTSGWTSFDISYIVNKFKTDSDYTTDFEGVIIKANSESTSTWKKFVSSLNTTYSSTYRPYIEITYNDSPTACSQVVSGATYYLKNYNSEYLDVYDAGTTDNTRLLTYTFNGNANQQFKITNVYGGEYEIAPQHTTGKVLSVNSSGQVVIEEDCNLSRQRWYIFYRNGSYHIVNKLYNTGVMEATYDSDYVNVGSSYDYCCWELEVYDPYAEILSTLSRDEYYYITYPSGIGGVLHPWTSAMPQSPVISTLPMDKKLLSIPISRQYKNSSNIDSFKNALNLTLGTNYSTTDAQWILSQYELAISDTVVIQGTPAHLYTPESVQYCVSSYLDLLHTFATLVTFKVAAQLNPFDADGNIKFKPDKYTQYYDANGNPIWPGTNGNVHTDGFMNGYSQPFTFQEGDIFDRFGSRSGRFVAPVGTSYSARALAPGSNLTTYEKYVVNKSFDAYSGFTAPWFNQAGGGIQYKLPMSIQELIDAGYISVVS